MYCVYVIQHIKVLRQIVNSKLAIVKYCVMDESIQDDFESQENTEIENSPSDTEHEENMYVVYMFVINYVVKYFYSAFSFHILRSCMFQVAAKIV